MFYKIKSQNILLDIITNDEKLLLTVISNKAQFYNDYGNLIGIPKYGNFILNFIKKNKKFLKKNININECYLGYFNIDYCKNENRIIASTPFSKNPSRTISVITFIKELFNDDTVVYNYFLELLYPFSIDTNVSKYYDSKLYYSEKSTMLGKSCMNDKIYTKFYDNLCKILVIKDLNDKVVGRALIWDVYYIDNFRKKYIQFIDRMYYLTPEVYSYMLYLSKKLGLYRRSDNEYSTLSSILSPNDKKITKSLFKDINVGNLFDNISRFPYLDTFCKIEGDRLCSSNYAPNNFYITSRNTDGSINMYNTNFYGSITFEIIENILDVSFKIGIRPQTSSKWQYFYCDKNELKDFMIMNN